MVTTLRLPLRISTPSGPLPRDVLDAVESQLLDELGPAFAGLGLDHQTRLEIVAPPSAADPALLEVIGRSVHLAVADATGAAVFTGDDVDRLASMPANDADFTVDGRYRLPSYEDGNDTEVDVAGDAEGDPFPSVAQIQAELRRRADEGSTNPAYYGGVRGYRSNVGLVYTTTGSQRRFLTFYQQHYVRNDETGVVNRKRVTASWPENSRVQFRYRREIDQEWLNTELGDEGGGLSHLQGSALFGVYINGSFVSNNLAPHDWVDRSMTIRVGIFRPDEPGEGGGGGGLRDLEDADLGEGGDGDRGGDDEGGGDADRRQGGGPLGEQGTESGSVWPTFDGAEQMVCEPFEGEKALNELPLAVQERLRPLMEDLSRVLEADACKYAGNTAVALAHMIGARARGVGLAARSNPGRTTVTLHPDGGGNNGFVNIEQEDTPALGYLRALAGYLSDALLLGRAVASSYSDLGDDGAVDYYQGWSTDFLIALGDALVNSAALLFAETCRVIILQQLATTKDILHQRRHAGLDETVSHFESALGILGERIVSAELLQRAMRRSRQLGVTGSAREILEQPSPIRNYHSYSRASYQPSILPPTTDEHLLALIDDAEITGDGYQREAVWLDRRWDHNQLNEFKQMRRAFLNRIDPLFLQIEDVSSWYGDLHDGGVRTRLKRLLDTLIEANRETTSEAKAADDGHWFSVETSQYIEAQGGSSVFGTHYELRGIHGLAHAELHLHVGLADYQFRRGVDRAISRKAGLDALKTALGIGFIIVLGVICAPLGAVAAGAAVATASVGLAAVDLYLASEREELYRSLENPELILSWQEVQLEWTMAMVGAAFSVFDVIPIVRGGTAAAKLALRRGAMGAVRESIEEAMERVALGVMDHAIRQAMSQVVLQGVMMEVLPVLLRPVITPYMQSVAAEHGLGIDIDGVLDGDVDVAELRARPRQETTVMQSGSLEVGP